MPYLKFKTKSGDVQLSGNKADDFTQAIQKNDAILHPKEAIAYVEAYFKRRELQVILQKIQRGEMPKMKAEEVEDQLADAEDDEEEAKETLDELYSGKKREEKRDDGDDKGAAGAGAGAGAGSGSSSSSNPYADVAKNAPRNVVKEDDFM